MRKLNGMYPLEPWTPSLLRQEPLLNDSPAPPGTMFVLGPDLRLLQTGIGRAKS